MPATKRRHTRRRDRLAMAGAAIPSRIIDSDAHMDSDSYEDLESKKKSLKRKWNGKREFVTIKRWITREKAKIESEPIALELFELARD